MLKKYFIVISLCLIVVLSFAQNGIGIKERIAIENTKSFQKITLLVKGDIKIVKAACVKYKAVLKYSYGDMSAVDIMKESYDDFLAEIGKMEVEIPISKGQILSDTALIHNNIVDVHLGTAPLPQPYTGADVIVGILDAGIYFNHDDFRKANGDTRIRYIWDQNLVTNFNSPMPYDYGEEWSWQDINNGTCNHIEPSNQFGHGTTVAGIATGNGLATGDFKGVAPDAEIIAVAINFSDNNFLGHIADGVDYCFKKADALGKPCVVNASLGTYYGAHDGRDMATQLIEAMIEEKEGRAMVAAAGNGNNIGDFSSSYLSTHLSYDINADTSFTWFSKMSSGQVYFDLWADTADFNNVNFAVGNDDTSSLTFMGRTDFLNVLDDFQGDLSDGVFLTKQSFSVTNGFQGTVEMYVEESEGRYHIEFLTTPVNGAHLWRLMMTGSGTFDIWASAAFQGTSNIVQSGLPPNFIMPAIDNYKLPDNHKTIVSSFQCSDKVITVGNFANRGHYFDVDTIYRSTGLTPGEIYYKSSAGPTRDNRLKPDISATGNIIFATGNLSFITSALAINRPKVAIGSMHTYNGGTSSSSPVVAGAVALYLEKNPSAPWYEIKEVITRTAKKDNYTGSVENNIYGHGKLDGFAALQYNAVVGCIDPTAFNFDPAANIDDGSCIDVVLGCIDEEALNFDINANTDDGSCIPIVHGCMDSLALNFDSLANMSNDSCVYDSTGTSVIDLSLLHFTIYPNPFEKDVTISFQGLSQNIDLVVYDILGKKIEEYALRSGQNKLNVDASKWQKGIYIVRLEQYGTSISRTRKLILQ